MRSRWVLLVLAAAAVAAAGAVASSGLVALTIDRNVQATVVADNSTAAVKFECINNSAGGGMNYLSVCDYSAGGALTLRLHNGLGGTATGFNPSAWFQIGSSATNRRVLRVTNNSGISVKVWLEDANNNIKMYNEGGLVRDGSGNAETLAPGASHEFYFEVNTGPAPATLTATLKVREQ